MTAKQKPLPKRVAPPPRDIHIRLPDDALALLCQVAQRECRSVRGQAEWFIRRGLEQYDARVPAPNNVADALLLDAIADDIELANHEPA